MKPLAIALKILAAILWIAIAVHKIGLDIISLFSSVPPRDADKLGWGTPAYYYWTAFEILLLMLMAVLAVTPNRRLVFSRKAFGVSLLLTLIPFCVVLVYDCVTHPSVSVSDFFTLQALMNATITFAPLPVSLALSFWRQQRGQKVSYA